MSFIISVIYQQKDVYIASDTKISSKFGINTYDNQHKIKSISNSLYIGIAGDYIFGMQLLEQNIKSLQQAQNIKEIEQILSQKTIINNKLWRDEYNINADCVFMIACLVKGQPFIALNTLSEGEFLNFHDPFQAGKYQFFLSNPTDFEFSECLTLCTKILLSNQDMAPDLLLKMIVNSVADRSQYVNHCVDIRHLPTQNTM